MIKFEIGDSHTTAKDVPPPDEANTEQTYSVHFLRFKLDDDQRAAMADLSIPVWLSVDHPMYHARVEIGSVTRSELATDLGLAVQPSS
jgi:hypothetical protein